MLPSHVWLTRLEKGLLAHPGSLKALMEACCKVVTQESKEFTPLALGAGHVRPFRWGLRAPPIEKPPQLGLVSPPARMRPWAMASAMRPAPTKPTRRGSEPATAIVHRDSLLWSRAQPRPLEQHWSTEVTGRVRGGLRGGAARGAKAYVLLLETGFSRSINEPEGNFAKGKEKRSSGSSVQAIDFVPRNPKLEFPQTPCRDT